MTRFSRGVLVLACVGGVALACDPPPPQGPQQLTYQNGFAQTTPQAYGRHTNYQNGYAQQGVAPQPSSSGVTYTPSELAPSANLSADAQTATASTVPMQTTPVPVGVQALPPPSTTAAPAATANPSGTLPPLPATGGVSVAPSGKAMATPGSGAFACSSDAQCLLGRCNLQFKRCAYPCKNSEVDCKAGNVCTATGLCMPRGAAGVGM